MATELRSYTATIPAGTPIAAPASVDLSFAAMITERIEWHQPRGAQGQMGWRLTSGGAMVVPKNPGSFIITDGQTGSWELAGLHDSGKWELTGYNLGTFAHSVNIRFHVRPITGAGRGGLPLEWLSASKPGRMLAEVGTLANASASVTVPRAALWPPVRP